MTPINISIRLEKTVQTNDGNSIRAVITTDTFCEDKISEIDFNAICERLDAYSDMTLAKYYEESGPVRIQSKFDVPKKTKAND